MANQTLKIKLSTPQLKVFKSRTHVTLNMAGQRSGKSHLIGIKSGLFVKKAPKIRGMIGANTYLQLTQSTLVEVKKVWKSRFGFTEYDSQSNPNGDYVVNKQPPKHFTKFERFDNYHSIISFRNGCIIYAVSLDNYMSHDGKEIGWAELDETKDTKEEALKAVILARLSQTGLFYHNETLEIVYYNPKDEKDPYNSQTVSDITDYTEFNPCCINTSPSVGVVKWLTDMFKLEDYHKEIFKKCTNPNDYFYIQNETQTVCIYSTYWNAHNIPTNYISNRLSQLSEGEGLKYIYGYPFARTGDVYFRHFSKDAHVREVPYEPGLSIHLTYDFNVKPYMTQLCGQVMTDDEKDEFQIRIFKEYCLSSPFNSTEAVCKAFRDDFESYDPLVYYYGDASGDYRQAGSGDHTQFDTVRETLYMFTSNTSDRVPPKNKSVLNRRDFIDKILENKLSIFYNGKMYKVVLMIDKSCEHTINDMQWLKEGVDGKLKEKEKDPATGVVYEKLGHTSDALEYFVCELLDQYYS